MTEVNKIDNNSSNIKGDLKVDLKIIPNDINEL